jgi:PHP family Zn ribbon phosphoesterase
MGDAEVIDTLRRRLERVFRENEILRKELARERAKNSSGYTGTIPAVPDYMIPRSSSICPRCGSRLSWNPYNANPWYCPRCGR